jgi:predicted esterase
VATVSSSGLATGVGAGTATITATCEGKSGSAAITVPTYALTVSTDGTGSGTVTSDPTGIDCGSTCSAEYASGTQVTLTASAAGGSVFVRWGGACSGTTTGCQVAMTEARSVTATFDLSSTETHPLTIWKSGSGTGRVTSDPGGIDCGSACEASFAEGTEVTLTAAGAGGSVFAGWSGACSGTESTCRITLGSPRLAMARFRAGPYIVSSYPEPGAVAVDPWIGAVEFHFSEPMRNCGFRNRGWWPYDWLWSADRETLALVRTEATPLYGWKVHLEALRTSCIDHDGNPLEADYILEFETAFRVPPIRVEANPAEGFHWPYYLVLPTEMEAPNTLLVETNKSGTWSDDSEFHDDKARFLLSERIPFAEELGSPLLVPVFTRPYFPQAPEPGGIYTHALDRYSLINDHPGLERIDLQLEAMIDDALDRLEALGHTMDRRIYMMGYSASGAFTSRFSLIHPDRVKAAAAGSPGGWPLAPIASWQGTPLKYAMGIADLESLVGEPFDLDTFKTVAFYIYVGDQDTNDAFDVRGQTQAEKDQIYALINWPADPVLASRWPLAQAMYESVGANAQFVIYPGVAHEITEEVFDDVLEFFQAHR